MLKGVEGQPDVLLNIDFKCMILGYLDNWIKQNT